MRLHRGGFTIVESMIFLTISAVMFVGVIAAFQGTQKSTQFSQSVREFESNLNDILNDTATGVFPQLEDVRCIYQGSDSTPSFLSDIGAKSGDNNDCIFLGKAIQFGDGTDRETYLVHSLIANNQAISGSVFFGDSTAIYDSLGISTLSSATFDTVEAISTDWGTEIKHAYYVDAGGNTVYVWAVGAIYNQFGSSSNSNFQNGLARISLTAITADGALANSAANAEVTSGEFKTSINRLGDIDFDEDLKGAVSVCLVGGNDEQAVVDIGRSDGGLNAVAVFEERPECA